jgi:hypothetical protein
MTPEAKIKVLEQQLAYSAAGKSTNSTIYTLAGLMMKEVKLSLTKGTLYFQV